MMRASLRSQSERANKNNGDYRPMRPSRATTRRTVLKTLGAGVGGVAIAGPASAGTDELSSQLNEVRAATRTYRDLENARDDGYVAISPYVPGMGFHFSDRTPPFGEDRTDPPVLVYFANGAYDPDPGDDHDPDRDDDLVLGAVEWLVEGDRTEDPPNLFADEGSSRTLKTTEEEGWHYEEQQDFTGLHAWVHRGNSEGVFHPTNPAID